MVGLQLIFIFTFSFHTQIIAEEDQKVAAEVVMSGKEDLAGSLEPEEEKESEYEENEHYNGNTNLGSGDSNALELDVEIGSKEEQEIMTALDQNEEEPVEYNIEDDGVNKNMQLENNQDKVNVDELELEVEIDTKEENQIMAAMDNKEETQTGTNSAVNQETILSKTSDAISNPPQNNNAYTSVKNDKYYTGEPTMIEKNNVDTGKNDADTTAEFITKFKEQPKPLWKIKDFADTTHEAGFDLTDEEMEQFKIWYDGVIPYYIDVVSFSDKVLRDKIRNYLQTVNAATGVNFVELHAPPSADNQRWVFFMNRRGLLGCADHSVKNFTNQGAQRVVLGYNCMATQGELAEAVMSILGVPAQHNAPDRDDYIKVNMDNIMPDKKHFFEKLNDNEWLFHDLGYDYNSITHYDLFKYSVNGRPTIQPKNDSTDFTPSRTMSTDDFLKIKMLYNYLTRNSQMNTPACEKLFKPRSEFERFVPNKALKKPRDKPARYLSSKTGRMSLKHSNGDSYRDKYVKQLIENAEIMKNAKMQEKLEKKKTIIDVKKTEKHTRNNGGTKFHRRPALTALSDYHSE